MPEITTPPPSSPETDLQDPQSDSMMPSVVPHPAPGTEPARIRSGRYGEMTEHELINLLDSIEDERARGRFRESIYISVFVYIALALVVLYGPKYLWHAPRIILPSDVLRNRELTRLEAPVLRHAPTAIPRLDNRTLNRLRTESPRTLAPRPAPTPSPSPAPPPAAAKPAPSTSAPTPAVPLPPPSTQPNIPIPSRPAPPAVADAPRPQPTTRPSFAQPSTSAGDAIQQAVQNAARNRGSGSFQEAPSGGGRRGGPLQGGMEVLSDTQGVDFDPYLARIKRMIEEQWYPLIPEEAQPPLMKGGVTVIRFTINADGSLAQMHLDDSTGDNALNKAAWGSVVGVGQFPPLPKQFHGPNLELRFGFYVNRSTQMR